MTESQKWRPPLAPKPSLQVPTVGQRDISPALRGATAAFSPVSATSSGPIPSKAANSALGAATIADRAKREQDQKSIGDIRDGKSPVRGRLAAQRTGELQTRLERRNPLQRTASEIAAKAASASSSPSRLSTTVSRTERPTIPARSSSRESTVRRGRPPTAQGLPTAVNEAVRHTTTSLPEASLPKRSPEKPRLDFDNVPSLPALQPQKPKILVQPESRSFLNTINSPITTTKATPPSPPPKRQPNKTRNHAASDPPVQDPQPDLRGNVTDSQKSSANVMDPPPRASLPIPVPHHHNGRKSPRTAHSMETRSPQGSMTPYSLSDAIVASSLASRHGSRANSPSKHLAPGLPRRRSRSMDLLRASHSGEKVAPLKPLPRKPMRQTMRKQSPEDEEEEEDPKRGRKHFIRKHPNMHHEGDRKRWRDKVTDRERKRFEGVWAANRGLLHEFESDALRRKWPRDMNPDDLVLNVIVREVWSRSRLPAYTLEEIWDLVAPDPDQKALNREQFVVGLWLLDQRLKGRKLPIKVSPSVWTSVTHVGIKVKSKHF